MKSIIPHFLVALFFTVSVHANDPKGEVVRILVPDMACESCSATVGESLKRLEGVSEAIVNLKHKVVLISTKTKIDDKILEKAVNDTGFTARKIERIDLSFDKAKVELENSSS